MSPAEEALVRALARAAQVLPRAVNADMALIGRVSLSEYTALMHLSEAQGRMMRVGELAEACSLTLSGSSRIIDRLEKRALVARVKCEQDSRGANVVLTEEGLGALEESWPIHLASVRRHVLDHVRSSDLLKLTEFLQKVAADFE